MEEYEKQSDQITCNLFYDYQQIYQQICYKTTPPPNRGGAIGAPLGGQAPQVGEPPGGQALRSVWWYGKQDLLVCKGRAMAPFAGGGRIHSREARWGDPPPFPPMV